MVPNSHALNKNASPKSMAAAVWHVRLTAAVHVPCPVARAFYFFTPEGERDWGHGAWDPQYPAGLTDDTEPGCVFVTNHDARSAVWIVTDRAAGERMGYARVLSGKNAGTVTVSVCADGDQTIADVTYELTALSGEGATELAGFARRYADIMQGWEDAIADVLKGNLTSPSVADQALGGMPIFPGR